jgi:hypothetical protein
MHFTSVTAKTLRNLRRARKFYFFRLAGFFFSGLTSNTRRIKSSNAGSGFHLLCFDFTLLKGNLALFYRHQRQKVKTTQYAAKAD